jgi:hypothetical protein
LLKEVSSISELTRRIESQENDLAQEKIKTVRHIEEKNKIIKESDEKSRQIRSLEERIDKLSKSFE